MKSLIVITLLTASLWSSFLHADQQHETQALSITGGIGGDCPISAGDVYYFPRRPTDGSVALITYLVQAANELCPGLRNWTTAANYFEFRGPTSQARYRIQTTNTIYPHPPSETCPMLEGGFLEARHNSHEPFCAHVGSTGGPNPEPLLCMTREVAEVPAGSGSHIHEVTAEPCTTITGPTDPDGDGDDDGGCTENCDDDGGDDGGGGSGSGDIPSTGSEPGAVQVNMGGTFTDSAGNVTNVNLTMENDFTPITVRQNETNQRLAALQDQLYSGQQQTNQRLDGVISAIDGIGSVGSDVDTSGIESRLDAINDRFNDADSIPDFDNYLPSYTAHLEMMHNQVSGAMVSESFQGNLNQLEGSMEGLDQGFTSFAQLWQFHNASCSPIPFGQSELNFCGMAPTVSNILTWVATVLTAIFIIHGVIALLLNVRLT